MAQTTVPLNTPTEQPTRRALLGTMAAAGIVGAAPAMAAGEVDPHLAWEREAAVLRAQARAPGASKAVDQEQAYDALVDRIWALEDRIASTPASTAAGIATQVRLAIVGIEEGFGDTEEQALRSAAAALGRLARRASA